MRRAIVSLLVAFAALFAPAGAIAHPLGNFTVNHFAAVEASGSELYLHYALDLAEIPTLQEGDRVALRVRARARPAASSSASTASRPPCCHSNDG